MPNKLLFSILIPNLGYSYLLFECLDSVVCQETNSEFNYEIVLCDQSDLDAHEKIKNEIISRYGSGKINLIHSNIKSLYQARHTLMKRAHGDYVVFIDSDDFVDKNYLAELYKIIKDKNNPDVILTDYTLCSFDKKKTKSNLYLQNLNRGRFLDYLCIANEINNVWAKIFRKDLYDIKDYGNFKYPLIKCGEDKIFSTPFMKKAKKIYCACGFVHYYYRNTPNSMAKKPSLYDLNALLEYLFLNLDFNDLDRFKRQLLADYICALFSILSQKHNKTGFKEFRNYARRFQILIKRASLKVNGIDMKFKKRVFLVFLRKKLYVSLYIASFFI